MEELYWDQEGEELQSLWASSKPGFLTRLDAALMERMRERREKAYVTICMICIIICAYMNEECLNTQAVASVTFLQQN